MISDEAVEAAAKAWLDVYAQPGSWKLEQSLRTALEAAAPHMLAPLLALADERDETPGAIRGHITTYEIRQATNPYRSPA